MESDISAVRAKAVSFQSHRLFQDYQIAFEYCRTMHERAWRGETGIDEQICRAGLVLQIAHAAWQDQVMKGGCR